MKGNLDYQKTGIIESLTPSSIDSSKVDDALKYLRENALNGTTENFSLEEEDILVRKIDWMLLPLMAAAYNIQFLDKTICVVTLTPVVKYYHQVVGLSKDTHTTASQFSYLATAFHIGYLVCEFPQGYMIQKFPLATYLGINRMQTPSRTLLSNSSFADYVRVILCGLCVALNCASTNYASIVVLRVLLGCFESVISQGLILLTSMWYKKNGASSSTSALESP
ncbi:hypothetical protein B0J14DRAFT_677545 [Halenospora varia]|nr:hypothetical protein B0J14DRAFT_677545 [Halenospora varia]